MVSIRLCGLGFQCQSRSLVFKLQGFKVRETPPQEDSRGASVVES